MLRMQRSFFIAFYNLFQWTVSVAQGLLSTPSELPSASPRVAGAVFSRSDLGTVSGSQSWDAELGCLPERERLFM